MNENVDLFICTDRDYHFPNNQVYKILRRNKKINTNLQQFETKTELSTFDKSLCEGTSIYYVYKNMKLNDYVGFFHYRRYFDFYENVLNINEIFKMYDIILPTPNKTNMHNQYQLCHNIEDLNLCLEIIKEKFPKVDISCVYKNIDVYWCNIFIMKKDDFIKYCSFVFSVIKEFCKRKNFNSYDDILKYVTENWDKHLRNEKYSFISKNAQK